MRMTIRKHVLSNYQQEKLAEASYSADGWLQNLEKLFHFYSKKGENMVAGFCSTQDTRIPEYNSNFNQGWLYVASWGV